MSLSGDSHDFKPGTRSKAGLVLGSQPGGAFVPRPERLGASVAADPEGAAAEMPAGPRSRCSHRPPIVPQHG